MSSAEEQPQQPQEANKEEVQPPMAPQEEKPKRPAYMVNVNDLPLFGTADFRHIAGTGDQWDHTPESEKRFGVKYRSMTAMLGATGLGSSYNELPPGKSGWPFHYHLNNEEAIFIIEGEGIISVPEGDFSVKKGDFIQLNAGKEFGHRLTNTSKEEVMKYLVVSTLNTPDVCVYPTTGKYAIYDYKDAIGMKFHDLGDKGLQYYHRTAAAKSPFKPDAVRVQESLDMDFEAPPPVVEKPEE